MRPTTLYSQFGPEWTPPFIKQLIIAIASVSIICALLHPLFAHVFGVLSPAQWLSLSKYGMSNYFIWQPLTYPFIQEGTFYGISLSYLISLCFNMYILWVVGTAVMERINNRGFILLATSAAILSGLMGLLAMYIGGSNGYLSGPVPIILALFVVWTCLYSESEILLFFVFPIKTKWLLAGVAGILLLISLSHADGVSLLFYGTGMLVGYLYAVTVLGLRTPFSWTHPLDDRLTIWYDHGMKFFRRWFKKSDQESSKAKIFDIKSGDPVFNDDDQFIDAMLTKISRDGEKSLSAGERRRMREISERKNQKVN
ncbi:rhomboid family intramembrane serine protease [Parachlamydia acanthamoebae]|jgi:hypothetical protein|uniref:rhomboid family intramembrane serine protease n=1 Tax=Parachlamydia acanthamoebae TaxID=83552 RepID=UPI0001C17C32|nr:rhomboid family intramembrane serine protease [Parachlamydia acanthamoebae]EFB42689.1 hypothetical protein pah_c004o243 [Parachlamydia acanthamoebae str. Hall's coccus]